jgi:predicted Zn-dependent protease
VYAASVELFPATEFWLQGDAGKALAEADRLAATLASREGEEQGVFALFTAGLNHGLGRLRRAEEYFKLQPERAIRHWNLALLALEREDQAAFEKQVREMSRSPQQAWWLGVAIFYARAGLLAQAEDWIRRHPNNPGIEVVRGEVALARGRKAEAEAQFRQGFEATRRLHRGEFGDAVDSYARTLEQRGDWPAALQVLEDATKRKNEMALMGEWPRWLDFEHRRARLLRQLGRMQEAQRIEAELSKLLAYADPDHAIARDLRAAGKLHAAELPR